MLFSDHLSRNVDISAKKPNEPTYEGLDLKIQDVNLNASNDKSVLLASETDKNEALIH